jgi:hypothetical protein
MVISISRYARRRAIEAADESARRNEDLTRHVTRAHRFPGALVGNRELMRCGV